MSELRKAGLQLLGQRAVPILATSFSENRISYWLTKLIPGYVVGRGSVVFAYSCFLSRVDKSWQRERLGGTHARMSIIPRSPDSEG
jgi:hypothetical protein